MNWSENHAAALEDVFENLNKHGLQWLVLRNYEGLPEINRSKDIDLGMEKKNFPIAKKVISESLKQFGFNYILLEDYQYAQCYTFFKLEEDQIISIKIDLLDGFVWRGAQLFDFNELYKVKVPYKNIFVPSKVDDSVMLWMKPLLTGGFVKKKYVGDIIDGYQEYPEEFKEKLNNTFNVELGGEIASLIQSEELEETIPYKRRLSWLAWRKAFKREPNKTIKSAFKHIYSESLRRLKCPKGAFIAVVGPDGVGKTTFINQLRNQLSSILVKNIEAIEITHFRPDILPNIKKLLSSSKYDASTEEFHRPHRATQASVPSSFLRLSYYWSDYILGYWFHNRKKCIRNKIIIFDRYFYDFIVDPRRSRLNLPLWVRQMFLHITPEPDLVFFLDCDPDVVFARKQELSRDEIERQLIVYRKLTSANHGRFVKLDSNQSVDALCQQALFQFISHNFDKI